MPDTVSTIRAAASSPTASPRRVGLVFGGRSVEHEVSIASARNIARALCEAGHAVVPLGVASDGAWVEEGAARRALDGEIDRLAPLGRTPRATLHRLLDADVDVIFPIVHGTWGEDGALQGLCEMLDLPYVGPDVTASAVAIDKALTKQVLAAQGLPVVEDLVVTASDLTAGGSDLTARCAHLGLPLFVKPATGGSSVGVHRVEVLDGLTAAVADALRFADRVLIERAVVGRELECAVLGPNDALEASAIGEIRPGESFYDYADKYLEGDAELIEHAELPSDLEASLRSLATRAFAAIGGSGMARVDFLIAPPGDGEEGGPAIFVNEINTLPGFTDISMYPKLWEIAGLEPARLVDRLVAIAFDRHGRRRRLDDGIRAWIAELEARSLDSVP
ncbi:MAG: D-alanine--D-alanine ligase family protein [Acidobacteriota bacterium]